MRVPDSYPIAADAMLGVNDSMTLNAAVSAYAPGSPKKVPQTLREKLTQNGVLAFVGNPPLAFISEAVARVEIPAHYAKKDKQPEKPDAGRCQETDQRGWIAQQVFVQLRADILAEIAKVRESINGLRRDLELLRGAHIKGKTEIEKSIDALVSILADENTKGDNK